MHACQTSVAQLMKANRTVASMIVNRLGNA
jgi:hypothetical protein